MYTATQHQQTCYTTVQLYTKIGQLCIAFDEYGTSHRFTLGDVFAQDVPGLREGVALLIHDSGLVELASASFIRFHEAVKEERSCNTLVLNYDE